MPSKYGKVGMWRKPGFIVFYILIFFALCLGVYLGVSRRTSSYQKKYNTSTLVLAHVLMRHGHRTPGIADMYPSNPYADEKYYPEGYGQLNSAGKKKSFEVGQDLRKRYDDFLGPTYNAKYVDVRSSDTDRTKMAMQVALAGLYPPKGFQIWSSLNWQPIPYKYVPRFLDKEIAAFWICPRFHQLSFQLYEDPVIRDYLARYNKTFEILTSKFGKKMHVVETFLAYMALKSQEDMGYPLEEWTKEVYPEPMHSLMIDMYYMMTNTTELRRVVTGFFLKKLLTDTEAKINVTPDIMQTKMFLYSGHEVNIATQLLVLGADTDVNNVPPYGAHLLYEMHRINGVYGMKIFYQNYKQAEPVLLRIRGCEQFCPFDEFRRLLENNLPRATEECFGNNETALMLNIKNKLLL